MLRFFHTSSTNTKRFLHQHNIIPSKRFSQSPINYETFLTDVSKSRKQSITREFAPILRLPGMIALANGLPNPNAFPFKSFSFQIPNNPILSQNNNDTNNDNSSNSSNLHEISLSKEELDIALQYSATNGLPFLVDFLKKYHLSLHMPPYITPNNTNSSNSTQNAKNSDFLSQIANDAQGYNFDLIVSTGSQDLVTRAMNELVECDSDSSRKDTILIEAPCYSGTLAYLKPLYKSGKINVNSIEMDSEGMIPSILEDTIKTVLHSTGKPPKCMYIIPVGHNPSGVSYSLSRKKEIYNIACKYDIIILEDDPYYSLQFNSTDTAPGSFDTFFSEIYGSWANKKTNEMIGGSLQSMDSEGRVIRFDSFSKVMSSGLRIGYASGPSRLINQILLNCQATHLHTSGMSQMLLFKVLEHWGPEQLYQHCANVAYMYYKQRDLMQNALNIHLNESGVEWSVPIAGMFYWLDLKNCYCYVNEDSKEEKKRIEDTNELIREKAMKHKVLMLPGKEFYLDSVKAEKCTNVRVGFSVATEEQMNEGIKRFRNLLA